MSASFVGPLARWTQLGVLFVALICSAVSAAAASFDLQTAKLIIGSRTQAGIEFADGSQWPVSKQPAFALEIDGTNCPAESLDYSGNELSVLFSNRARADFRVICERGFALFELVRLEMSQARTNSSHLPTRFQIFQLSAPLDAKISHTLNAATFQGNFAALMAAKPNVHAFNQQSGASHLDRAGCKHELIPSTGKVGERAASFSAQCDSRPGGWSMGGNNFSMPIDLTGCKALRAWVFGDGKGEALKIQLYDGVGGYRDNYLTIDFQGWRQVTLTKSPINTLRYNHVSTLNFYYNNLPASTSVTCLLDHVEAILESNGQSRSVVLEDFEDTTSPLWSSPTINLCVQTEQAHELEPAAFGLLACSEADFLDTVRRFEKAAHLPSPEFDGVWNKQSPLVKHSYLFLTNFRESQFDQALALARRGGFNTILLGQESWSKGTGHYDINRERFPDGLQGLARTIQRFKDAGLRVGLHFLAASIYPPDSYLTPVPDPRLVKGAAATLSSDIDRTNNFIGTTRAPEMFPSEDGGYNGQGTVLQIGDELIQYGSRKMEASFGFVDCKRGYLGTKVSAHKRGDTVRHLMRSYGYHMYDMDTALLDEVAGHFARVAYACGIDMIYFDGSERLQGDHWFYNARLHQSFYDSLASKDILLQASSFSHYSWHLLARSASADGHGDLKGYLDQRSGAFDSFAQDGMPLDIGWYYGYDPTTTPDMFEYVLGATIGYDSSMSFQVSCEAAAKHPFTGEILDLIARYEKLRLSGTLPDSVKTQFRIDPALRGIKPGETQPELVEKRREYRLLEESGKAFFQRVIYEPWHEIQAGQIGKTNAGTFQFRINESAARIGVQIHVTKGAELTDPTITMGKHQWTWKGKLAEGHFLFFWPNEPVAHYVPGTQSPSRMNTAPDYAFDPGEHTAKLTCHLGRGIIRTRITLQPRERIEF